MSKQSFRSHLLTGIAFVAGVAFANTSDARAQSLCDVDTDLLVFDCFDGSTDLGATGTFSGGHEMVAGYGRLAVASAEDLDVAFVSGELRSMSDAPVFAFSAGDLTYTSTGTSSTSGGSYLTNTVLNGASVLATTGTVHATGVGAVGIYSLATNGTNVTSGGTTVINGDFGRGLVTHAINGDNISSSGDITLNGLGGVAFKVSTGAETTCGNLTANVNGDIESGLFGVWADGCGTSTVDVQAGASISIHSWAPGILIGGQTEAITIISGEILADTASDQAISSYGPSTLAVVRSTGRVTGTISGDDGNDRVVIETGGAWHTSGLNWFATGTDLIENFGTISTSGQTLFDGLETFSNGGAIDLRNDAYGDSLTIAGDYNGTGGASLLIDGNTTAADQLIIGGAASGATSVFVHANGIITTPILIVDADTSTAGAFVLGNSSATPLIDLALTQVGAEYFVTATPNALAFQPITVGAVAQDMWYQSADVYASYAGLRRSDLESDHKKGLGLWGQLYASSDRHGDAHDRQTAFGLDVEVDNRVETDRSGIQVGIDYLLSEHFVVGATGGYQRADVDSSVNPGSVKDKGFNAGLYAQYGRATGLYAGLLAKVDWSDVTLTNNAFGAADGDPDSKSAGIEAELGYRTSFMGVSIELGSGLAYVKTDVDSFTAGGITYDFDEGASWRGRLGVRGEFGGSLRPFVDAGLYREFNGDHGVTLISGAEMDSIESEGRGTWGRLEAGFGSRSKPGPMLSAWADVGDVSGFGLRAGLRF
jgi:outer membrane autotransporter protein